LWRLSGNKNGRVHAPLMSGRAKLSDAWTSAPVRSGLGPVALGKIGAGRPHRIESSM
jgi:hypothetical protein